MKKVLFLMAICNIMVACGGGNDEASKSPNISKTVVEDCNNLTFAGNKEQERFSNRIYRKYAHEVDKKLEAVTSARFTLVPEEQK